METTKNFEPLAQTILDAVGGKDNISHFTHCMTRLRISLKNDSLVDEATIKNTSGVLGCQFAMGQLQVIIGKEVKAVYEAACKLLDMVPEKGLDENLDSELKKPKKSFSLKGALNACMDGLSGCLVPLLPVVIAGGMIKMIYMLLGPTMLNLISETSNTYQLLNLVGDAAYYFLPVFCGYAAGKKFNTNILISMILGAVLLHPSFVSIVDSGEPFAVYGIPMIAVSYSSTVIPMILITLAQSYVERLLKRISPDMLKGMIVPVATVLIMLPLALCVIGPLGSLLGEGIAALILLINNVFGPLSVALIAATFLVLVVTGAHIALGTFCMTQLFTVGFDNILLPASICSGFATAAVALAFALKVKNKEQKSLGITCAVSQIFSGVSEPTLFGILMPHKRIWGCLMVGAFAGGLYMGFLNVACYILAPSVYLAFLSFGGPAGNTMHGLIGCAISFIVSFLLVYFVGATKEMNETKRREG